MTTKGVDILHLIAALASLAGVGAIDLLRGGDLVSFGAGAIIATVVFGWMYYRQRNAKRVIGYDAMQRVCHNALEHARREVCFFAGDISWIDRDAVVLSGLAHNGCEIRILAEKPPGPTEQGSIARATACGARVRLYPAEAITTIRAVLIDPADSKSATLIAMTKRAKPNAMALSGVDSRSKDAMAAYETTLHSAGTDAHVFQSAQALFDAYWRAGTPSGSK
jgi:hypothetical protein